MWIDPVRGRTLLGGHEIAERGRRDERAVEASAEIIGLWWLVRVCRREGLRRRHRRRRGSRLRLAQLDGGCECGRRGRGLAERVAVGGLACTRRGLRLLCVVQSALPVRVR